VEESNVKSNFIAQARRSVCRRENQFLLLLLLAFVTSASAQTYTILHSFTRGQDGAAPFGGLTMDAGGNLYGTATAGGGSTNCNGGCGTVFKLSQRNGNWTLSPLYSFIGAPDGAYPEGRLVFGRDGRLYGTTGQGGLQNGNGQCQTNGCGTVFALRPPATFCHSVICLWSEQQVYQFTGNDDGARPTGDSVFDSSGNFYGTAYAGGASQAGTAYELSPSGGGWTFGLLHAFDTTDGKNPYGGLTFDGSGNLYGTTEFGGTSPAAGTVFQLSNSGSGWTENVLHNFNGTDGDHPLGGVILDAAGNLFGTTSRGGQGGGGGGQLFQLSPSGGGWVFSLIYTFTGRSGPAGDLLMDSSGAIYGTTLSDGAFSVGSVFKLTNTNGVWTYTSLHDFNGTDGVGPHGSLVLDANGNLFGTTAGGGAHNLGVVWEITP
jgi:uncharacterized repeat protein (TIGR03803 family)